MHKNYKKIKEMYQGQVQTATNMKYKNKAQQPRAPHNAQTYNYTRTSSQAH
jgi:dynactin complex subunit